MSEQPTSITTARVSVEGKEEQSATIVSYDWRFWIIIISLCITSLLTALESTVTSTTLPVISRELDSRELYVWFGNTLFLTSTSSQPLFGQLADVFGRRWPTIFAVASFALGCGISGGANSPAMLIAGRAIQGIGLGGVNMLIDIIVCDLVPLRERGNFMGIIFAVFSVGSSLGPFIGGLLVERASWRWVFYIGLPVAGTALLLMVLFLQVECVRKSTFKQKIKRIDFIGNGLLIASITSLLIALSWGGAIYPWSSSRVIVPLVLGVVGMIVFHIFEASSLCAEPTMPPHLFGNRTSASGYGITFLHGLIMYWVLYFLPVYFQAVKLSSPTRSGVQMLPTVIILVPFAIIAGGMVTKTGRYKPLQILGFALMSIGIGLFTLFDMSTSDGAWAGFQIIAAAGNGLIVTSTLPAIQAPLEEKDVALSTATWGFIRSVGSIFGVAIPAVIFNNRFDDLAFRNISDPFIRDQLLGGTAYEQASKYFIQSFPMESQLQIMETYSGAMRLVWQVAIAFTLLGFLIGWGEKEIKLRTTLDTEYQLTAKTAKSKDISGTEATDVETGSDIKVANHEKS